MRRVVITGVGAVSAVGHGAQRLWLAARDGISAIRPLVHPNAETLRVNLAAQIPGSVDLTGCFDDRELSLMDRFSQIAIIAAEEALSQSGLCLSESQELADQTAVIVGTGVGGDLTRDAQAKRLYEQRSERLHPLSIVRLMTNAPASQIAMRYGTRGPAYAVASACASSNHAIAQAVALIQSGTVDTALCGGTEAALSYSALKAWDAMRVLSADTCRPFCAKRSGLVLGEGAGMFVLESFEHAEKRGAAILAEIIGVGMSAGAIDIVHPDVDSTALAIERAVRSSKMDIDDIGYINAHGTGTRANDAVETKAIKSVFQHRSKHIPVSSTKPIHGHALGASGALELAITVEALRAQVIPPTINMMESDPECDLDYVPDIARDAKFDVAISNSFAFGGLSSSLVVRRFD